MKHISPITPLPINDRPATNQLPILVEMLAKKILLIYLVIFWPKKREIALFLNDIYNSAIIIFCDNQQSLHLLCLNDIENLE